MIPTHILKIPLSDKPDRLLLVEPPTDLSLLPEDIQTVLVSVSLSKGKKEGVDGGDKKEATVQDATGMLNAASQVTRLFVVGAINTDGSNHVAFRLADIHQSVGDLRPLAAISVATRMQVMMGVCNYLTSFRCEI